MDLLTVCQKKSGTGNRQTAPKIGGPGIKTGPPGPDTPEYVKALAKIKRISGPDWTFGLSPDTPQDLWGDGRHWSGPD